MVNSADSVGIGSLLVRYTMSYVTDDDKPARGEQRYVTIALTSLPERRLQRVLATCVDGHDMRSCPVLGSTGLCDDELWRLLC